MGTVAHTFNFRTLGGRGSQSDLREVEASVVHIACSRLSQNYTVRYLSQLSPRPGENPPCYTLYSFSTFCMDVLLLFFLVQSSMYPRLTGSLGLTLPPSCQMLSSLFLLACKFPGLSSLCPLLPEEPRDYR